MSAHLKEDITEKAVRITYSLGNVQHQLFHDLFVFGGQFDVLRVGETIFKAVFFFGDLPALCMRCGTVSLRSLLKRLTAMGAYSIFFYAGFM